MRRAARAVDTGSVCPTCGTGFRNRPRLMAHLERGAVQCRAAFREGRLAPCSQADIAAADLRDAAARRSARAAGLDVTVGPPAKRPRGAGDRRP